MDWVLPASQYKQNFFTPFARKNECDVVVLRKSGGFHREGLIFVHLLLPLIRYVSGNKFSLHRQVVTDFDHLIPAQRQYYFCTVWN